MAAQLNTLISPEEYLAQERKAEFKSEYLNGEVFAMSGAREAHVLIASNVGADLNLALEDKPCRVYTSEGSRGRASIKSTLYRTLKTLQEYLLIAQSQAHVECYTRQSDGRWLFTEADGLDSSVQLASLPVTLKLSRIYRNVTF